MSDNIICPECGNTYTGRGLTTHWTMSSTCSHPEFSADQVEILEGLCLTGGTFEQSRSDSNPSYRYTIRSIDQDLLEWVHDKFPVLGRPPILHITGEDAAEGMAEMHPQQPTDEMDASDVYAWSTRSVPAVSLVRERWTDDAGEWQVPAGLTPTPLLLNVVYAVHGRLETARWDESTYRVVFSLDSLRGDAAFWEQFLQRFAPNVTGGEYRVLTLRDSRAFVDYLQSDPVTGDDMIPGAEPVPEEGTLATLSEKAEACPSCGQPFESLGQHWSHSECPIPALPADQRAFLEGMFLIGGFFDQEAERASATAETARVRFSSPNREFLEWLTTWVSPFFLPVTERTGELSAEFQAITGEQQFDTTYGVRTRMVPEFQEFATLREESVNPQTLQSPATLRGLYAYRGRLHQDKPTVTVTTAPHEVEFYLALFDQFDPVHRETNTADLILCRNRAAFFDYIGACPCAAVADKWMAEDTDD